MENQWKRNLYVLWTGVFCCSMAYSMTIPFLPLFLHEELGVTSHLEVWSGVTFGSSFLVSALIAPFWGLLADKYGRKPMIIRSGISLCIVYLCTYFVTNVYELLFLRIFQGLLAGFVPSSLALIATNTSEKHIGYALGVMSTAGAAGSIIGPLVGGVVSHIFNFRISFLISALLVLLAVLLAWLGAVETNFKRSNHVSRVVDILKEAAANPVLIKLLIVVMLASSSVMIFEPLLTIYVLQLGATQHTAALSSGVLFSLVGIATVLSAPLWGKIGYRIGYRKTLFIGLLGGGISNLLLANVDHLIGFGLLRFLYGVFFAAVYPSLNALIVQVTKTEFRGRAFSLNQSASQLGNVMGPVVGGILAGWFPIATIFVMVGVFLISNSLLVKQLKVNARTAAQRR
jgi:DHA1 family multidrug resistance protein-like MFS transporter